MWTFDDLEPGALLGEASIVVDDALVADWLSLYADEPDPRPMVPAGMAMLIVMRTYAEAVHPRPPGNVHAGQALTIERVPRVGDRLTTRVRCESKELSKGRRWVRLAVETSADDAEPCYRGMITTLWAQ